VFEHPRKIAGKNLTQKETHYNISHSIFKTDDWTGRWVSISAGALPQFPLVELTALPRLLAGGEVNYDFLSHKPVSSRGGSKD